MSSRNKNTARGSRLLSTRTLQSKFGIGEAPRGWPTAISWGVGITVVMLAFAVVFNIWIGRTIHWDWVAGFGALSFIGLSVGRQARIF